MSDGTIKEYPDFIVDANGNGILTIYDNDEWDKNPAFGIIRDPGGPGMVSVATTDNASSRWCFIATAAYGSYLHPFVNILRTFRDVILLPTAIGRSFVQWYYRVSPPIADVIANNRLLSSGVRVLLLPAIGFAWLCLQMGAIPVVLMLLLICVLVMVATRIYRSRTSALTG